jgi:hypothetical protein
MILTSKKIINSSTIFLLFFLIFPTSVFSQSTLTLSISPTLFKMSASPEQNWSSSIKVINSNKFNIQVDVNVVNFAPQGESGQGKFIPIEKFNSEGQTLAEWIKLDNSEFTIPAEQTVQVPFTISLPQNAPPGSHSAAIQVKTKSMSNDSGQMKVETSQVVTTLVFLRVEGDVVEDASIREFRTTEGVYASPIATFELRIENKGNVHVQPQGEIKIYNMWGNERGIIPVNRQTLFGDVLRESIRKYTFTWSGDWSVSDMGRYTAIAALAYGEDGRKTISSETAFWVIPWKILGMIMLVLLGFFAMVSWAIKLYVRKMLIMAGVSPEFQAIKHNSVDTTKKQISVVAPIEAGILDLRYRFSSSNTWLNKLTSIAKFINNYRIFFFVVVVIILFITSIIWYVKSASVSERGYEITYDKDEGGGIVISSEELKYNELLNEASGINQNKETKEFPIVKIINRSGITGLAAQLRLELETKGYVISDLNNELGATNFNTVIVYAPEYAEQALEISKEVKGSLLSAFSDASNTDTPIIIYVGQDLKNDVQ